MNLVIVILAFIFTIGLLVAIHEYGHFRVARAMGVKVLRFSVGFGNPLFSFRGKTDNTEYVVAAIPLGGYVKMLDEREGEVAPEERARAFNTQNVYKRFAIVFAGPAVNLVFAVFAFWFMYILGVQGVQPLLGNMHPDSIAWQAGLRQGDKIVAVDDVNTPTMTSVYEQLLEPLFDKGESTLKLADGRQVILNFSMLPDDIQPSAMRHLIGFILQYPLEDIFIGEVMPDSPASRAGLQQGDQIIGFGEYKLNHWLELVQFIIQRPDQQVNITIFRSGREQIVPLTIGRVTEEGEEIGRIGIKPESITPLPAEMRAIHQYGPVQAVGKGIEKTWDLAVLTLKMLGKIVIGEASVKNISGPITIAEVAGESAKMGMERFLWFLGVVSLSLGVINLLPIPVLDGGHLLFYVVEMIRGKPVSDAVQEVGLKIGMSILVMLMGLALYNDLTRILG